MRFDRESVGEGAFYRDHLITFRFASKEWKKKHILLIWERPRTGRLPMGEKIYDKL